MLLVNTALSTHTACFICREKTRGLHQVKKKDIILLMQLIKYISNIIQDYAMLILMNMVLLEKKNSL